MMQLSFGLSRLLKFSIYKNGNEEVWNKVFFDFNSLLCLCS